MSVSDRIHSMYSSYGTKYSRMDQAKFFKGCLPQTLLRPFLNNLPHIQVYDRDRVIHINYNIW